LNGGSARTTKLSKAHRLGDHSQSRSSDGKYLGILDFVLVEATITRIVARFKLIVGRLGKWSLFNVLLAILPFISADIYLWFHGKIDDILTPWRHGDIFWPHGELFIIASAIGADALGGLVWKSGGWGASWFKRVSGAGCAVLVLLSFGWYGMVQADPKYNVARVVESSQVVLMLTLVVSVFCKVLSED
jgi:hypothetical protein